MFPIKNVQKIDKAYFSKNRSYAQNAGVYYNQDGFSSVTNNINQLQGTYNPDKYILGNVTKPNMKTFVNYDNKEKEHKGNNTKININNIKTNKETYAYVSNIMIPTIESKVKPIQEILKEKQDIIKNKNVIINSKQFKDKTKEESKVKDNIISYILKSNSSVSLVSNLNDVDYTEDINNDDIIYLNGWVFLYKNGNLRVNNFGDDINFSFLPNITRKKHKKYDNQLTTNYLMIGSIFIDKYINEYTEVWGSGMLRYKLLENKPYKVHAVRGPKTREICIESGIECPEIYGDPALLIPYYYNPYVLRKYKLGIIPHHSHIKSELLFKFKDDENVQIINFKKYKSWKDIIKQIRECDFIVSESLHGLIISETFRIPNIWVSIGESIDQDLKYEDFFLSINKPYYEPYLINDDTTTDNLLLLKENYNSTFNIDLQKLVDVCPIKLKYLNMQNEIKRYTGKVLLCCIGKMENNYIREFVEHHKSIGFDNIVLYDNNDIDGEHFEDVIADYIDSGYVILKDWRGKFEAQIPSYTDCYNTYKDEYDWIAYFDIDEFLELNCNDIHEFLSQDMYNDRGINTIRVCWRQYTDSEILKVEDNNYSIKRFTDYLPITNRHSVNTKVIVKTCIKNGTFDSPHGMIRNHDVVCVTTAGKLTQNSILINNSTWENARLNHYRFKTIEEYVMNKMVRLWPTNYLQGGKVGLNLNFFFRFNNKTQEKEDFANYLLDKYNINRNE